MKNGTAMSSSGEATHELTADMNSYHLYAHPSVVPLIGTFHTEDSSEHKEQVKRRHSPALELTLQ